MTRRGSGKLHHGPATRGLPRVFKGGLNEARYHKRKHF